MINLNEVNINLIDMTYTFNSFAGETSRGVKFYFNEDITNFEFTNYLEDGVLVTETEIDEIDILNRSVTIFFPNLPAGLYHFQLKVTEGDEILYFTKYSVNYELSFGDELADEINDAGLLTDITVLKNKMLEYEENSNLLANHLAQIDNSLGNFDVRLIEMQVNFDNIFQSEINAKESEDNAKISETNAKTSEDNAKVSEDNALESENKAKISENNSATSEQNALDYKNLAETYKNDALLSEQNAKISEDNAKISEDNALASANSIVSDELTSRQNADEAEQSAINAEQSYQNVLAYDISSLENANNAQLSEDNAKVSETNSKTSEDNALISEQNALASANIASNAITDIGTAVTDGVNTLETETQTLKDSLTTFKDGLVISATDELDLHKDGIITELNTTFSDFKDTTITEALASLDLELEEHHYRDTQLFLTNELGELTTTDLKTKLAEQDNLIEQVDQKVDSLELTDLAVKVTDINGDPTTQNIKEVFQIITNVQNSQAQELIGTDAILTDSLGIYQEVFGND